MSTVAFNSRRTFLKTSAIASGGLLLGVTVPALREAQAAGTLHTPNAWVDIADDNTITLISARSEMGQGVYTSMPMLIAEELGVDLKQVRVAIAPPDTKAYGNALLGGPQLTGVRPRCAMAGTSCASPAPRCARCWSPPPPP